MDATAGNQSCQGRSQLLAMLLLLSYRKLTDSLA